MLQCRVSKASRHNKGRESMRLHKMNVKRWRRDLTALIVSAVFAVALPASALDWQFTGATNRTAAVSLSCVMAGEFDSQIPSTVIFSGCNMRSDAVGNLILFR